MSSERQTRKRLATRRAISQAADRLFLERGFENVTVDDIAAAADVGRMTVFNHFPRKEDMFFDRDEEGRKTIREALLQRKCAISPIETLRLLAHRLVAEQTPYLEFSGRSQGFIETVRRSETLRARARAIRGELVQMVALAMTESVKKQPDDADAQLAAELILATWTVAFLQAHRTFQVTQQPMAATDVFLNTIDKGSEGVKAALAGSPYVTASA